MKDSEREAQETEPGKYQRETTPLWFVIGSLLVAAWVAYYIYKFWGGLGPGIPQ